MKKHPGKPVTIHYSKNMRWLNWAEDNPEDSVEEGYTCGRLIKLRDSNRDVVAFADIFPPTVNMQYNGGNFLPPCKDLNNNPDLWHYRIRPCTINQIKEGEFQIHNDDEDDDDNDVRFWFVDIEINIKV